MLLVPNPEDKKNDLEIKKVPLLFKTAGIVNTAVGGIGVGGIPQYHPHQGTQLNPLKNEFIENQLVPNDSNNNTNSTEDY